MIKLASPCRMSSSDVVCISSEASDVCRQQSLKDEREDEGEGSMSRYVKFNLKSQMIIAIADIIDYLQKMGNCEKSMFHERQKSINQKASERQVAARQTPQERSVKEQSANQNIVMPLQTQQSPPYAVINQPQPAKKQLCRLISNYGEPCNHLECRQEIVSPAKPKSPSKLYFKSQQEAQ